MIVLSFLVMAQVGLSAYDPKNPVGTTGLDDTAKVYGGVTKDNLEITIGKIVGVGLSFLGVVFFILMIYGGYIWMFSMGNEQTAGKAKDIIIAAVIGLAIVLMAYAITSFLGNTLKGQ